MSNCNRCGKVLETYEYNRVEDGIICDVCAGLKPAGRAVPQSVNIEIVDDDDDGDIFQDTGIIWKWLWGLICLTSLHLFFLHPKIMVLLDRGYQIKGALYLSLEAISFITLSFAVFKLQKMLGVITNIIFLFFYNKILIGNSMEGGYQTGQMIGILVVFNIFWMVILYQIFLRNRKKTFEDFK